MDCGNVDAMWEWQGEDYSLRKDRNLEMSPCLWNGVSQNEEDASRVFDETTPITAFGDLAYHVNDNVNTNKELQQVRERTSQSKRRRMLQFNDKVSETPLFSEMPSVFLKSKEREEYEAFSDISEWVSGFAEETSGSGYEGLDPSSDGWLADYFNDTEMHCSGDDMNLSGASDVQIDNSGFCDAPPECDATMAQKHPTPSSKNVVFKGRKSYMQTPRRLASSIAYPFAFVKPCGAYGDVTLNDINLRLCTPPSKSKQFGEDPSAYPTSAFSGKPVVGKTKIRTEGGEGSITIMRTKG